MQDSRLVGSSDQRTSLKPFLQLIQIFLSAFLHLCKKQVHPSTIEALLLLLPLTPLPFSLFQKVAIGFEKVHQEEKDYFNKFIAMFSKKRNFLLNALRAAGLRPIVPNGSYFILADTSSIDSKAYMNPKDPAQQDYQFCRWLTKEIGVAAIPPSAFYSPEHAFMAKNFARFCFCKKDETLEEGAKRLQKLKNFVQVK
jgi:aspartate/methionine/tyrosine aminotransferase